LAIKPKNSTSEIGTGEQAKQEAKQMLVSPGEFFGSLAFLVTFWAMQKVTRIPSCREAFFFLFYKKRI